MRASLGVAALALLAASPFAAARGDAAVPCALEAAPSGLPASWRLLASYEVTLERDVEIERATALAAVTLATVLDPPPTVRDVSDFEERRREVCLFERALDLDRQDALLALALGVEAPRGEIAGAAFDARVLVVQETETRQRVEVDEDVVFAVLALARAGAGPVGWEDIADVERETKVLTRSEVELDADAEETRALLALRGPR